MMVLTLSTLAWAGDQNTKIRSLVDTYKGTEGFDVVDIGGVGMKLLRAAARTAAETPEDRQALNVLNGIKRLTVVDFSDAAPEAREKFLQKARKLLSGGEMLLEAKDGGETVRIYGSSSENGNVLEDIVILAEDALISIRGTIRADQVGSLMNQAGHND